MSRTAVRRAPLRRRVLLVIVAAVALSWVVPGAPLPRSRASDAPDRHARDGDGCGTSWGEVTQLGDLPGNLLEVSGFVSSAKYPGVAWMVRDSDNPEELYSFELEGDRPRWRKFRVAGVDDNIDWEDIAYTVGADGRGRIWILENAVETGPKKLYEIEEPDPHRGGHTVEVANTYRFEYPGQNYNTEALFSVGGRLAVVTKTNPNRLFKLPADLSTSETNYASDAGGVNVRSWVTMASISADERYLAIVTTADDLSIIERRDAGGEISAYAEPDPAFVRSMPETQREAGDFFPYGACDVVMVSEDGTVWRAPNHRRVLANGSPGPPSQVSAVPADRTATVTWTPPADNAGAGITGYRVATRRDGEEVGSVSTPDGTATSAVVDGLANGVAYTFTVTALSASGPGPASAPSAPVIPAASPPAGSPPGAGDPPGRGTPDTEAPPAAGSGYWVVAADGAVYAFGAVSHHGDATGGAGPGGAVDLEPTPTGRGYWIVSETGRVHAFGDAHHLGDADPAALAAGEAVTSLSATPDGAGYWVFTNRGRVLPFGTAVSAGDLTHLTLNGPVLDSVATPSGGGYYMVAADGGVFAFGDARFYGSMGGSRLNAAVRSLVPDPDGTGYWLVASDGGVFSFEAPFRGSTGSLRLNRPVVGMVAYGDGYLMVGADGGVFNFSERAFHGSLGDRPPAQPVVAVAAG